MGTYEKNWDLNFVPMGWNGNGRSNCLVGHRVHKNARLRGQSPGLFISRDSRCWDSCEDYIGFPFDGAYQLFVGECHPCVVVVWRPHHEFAGVFVKRKLVEPHRTHERHVRGLFNMKERQKVMKTFCSNGHRRTKNQLLMKKLSVTIIKEADAADEKLLAWLFLWFPTNQSPDHHSSSFGWHPLLPIDDIISGRPQTTYVKSFVTTQKRVHFVKV